MSCGRRPEPSVVVAVVVVYGCSYLVWHLLMIGELYFNDLPIPARRPPGVPIFLTGAPPPHTLV